MPNARPRLASLVLNSILADAPPPASAMNRGRLGRQLSNFARGSLKDVLRSLFESRSFVRTIPMNGAYEHVNWNVTSR